jgi:hypothetical protein
MSRRREYVPIPALVLEVGYRSSIALAPATHATGAGLIRRHKRKHSLVPLLKHLRAAA